MRIKKVIVGLVCLFLISACGFEIPESITIKGNPGLYVPLGSPFAGMNDKDRLENLISPDKIKEMMMKGNSDPERMKVYEVSSDMVKKTLGNDYENVLTYLVEYQLDDIPLNLQKYIDRAMNNSKSEDFNIPSFPAGSGEYYIDGDGNYRDKNGTPYSDDSDLGNNPFMRIPLDDMVKFVKEVKRNEKQRFGLKISVVPGATSTTQLAQLEQNLRLKIPSLGIYDYIKGEPITGGLLFVNKANQDGVVFYPQTDLKDNGELWIYAKITGPCAGTIKPEIVYEWTTAIIYTSAMENGTMHETYTMGNNSFGNFLGSTVSFKKVLGYVYMYGMESTDPIYLTVNYGHNNKETRTLNFIKAPPYSASLLTQNVTGSLFPSSFIDAAGPLDMTEFFKNADQELEVEINIPELEITHNDDDDFDETIECKLCILIPLDLEVSDPSDPDKQLPDLVNNVNIKQNYVPLDLGESFFSGLDDTSDLFGRKEGEDNIINSIDYVKITLKDTNNITIIEPAKLAVLIKRHDPKNPSASQSSDYQLLGFSEGASLKLEKDFIRNPFIPKFTVLLKKDTTGASGTGSFRILRPVDNKPATFDFKLDVEAQAALEYNLKL